MSYKRINILYYGNVHGVGFRYTANGIASKLGLSGWVRNLPDESVEVVCEGEEEKLKQFLEMIKIEFPSPYIQREELTWEEPLKNVSSFRIKF